MNVLEKAEKALEYLKSVEGSTKTHELQAAAGTLGRCLGALGSRQNCARHYANLLHSAIPTLLSLASNDSAEVRLVGDEALNRAVVGGFAFHSHKTNIILQNQIDQTKNARWIRAALTRIFLGACWLRPGVGKIRTQAQMLFPKLSQIVRRTTELQLTLEALENNLDRILTALAEYTTDEEIAELSQALLSHVESPEPAVRRAAAASAARLCAHRDSALPDVCAAVLQKLWPMSADGTVIMSWFCVVKALFQINDVSKFAESDVFTVHDYLELYYLCIYYLERTTTEHNIQNAVLECLTTLLSQAKGEYRKALLERHPRKVCLDYREEKKHRRNISITSISSRATTGPISERESELLFNGALQLQTPSLSVEDLTIQSPDSPASEMDMEVNAEQVSKELLSYHQDLSEKLQEIEDSEKEDHTDNVVIESGVKVNIGASTDDDIPLKYCARLLASKFLLTANKGGLISDRVIRVSVKSSALNCLSEILQIYPQAITVYLDKDADVKSQNNSGSSEGTDYNQDQINDFILERNVCYQDSLTDSLTQDLLNRSIDSQSHSQQISKKDSKSLEKCTESVEEKSSTKDVQSNILDSKVYPKELIASGITDSTNPNMSNSNFTSNSNMTCSNDPTTGYPMSSSGDVLSSSIDLDMKFDHFGESTTNLDNLDAFKREETVKKVLKRTDEVRSKDAPEMMDVSSDKCDSDKDFEFQHMSDIFILFEGHCDPQIRGLVRVCIGNYLSAALELSHGDYNRWRNVSILPREVSENISAEKLVKIILKGLTDEIHSTVNHTLSALSKTALAISDGAPWALLWDCVNSLVEVEGNNYWLCRVNLCRLYEKLPYQKLFLLYPGFHMKSKIITDTLFRLLADQDQRVREAAAQTLSNIIPTIFISKRHTHTTMLAQLAKEQSDVFTFTHKGLSLNLVRNLYFYCDLPEELKTGGAREIDGLTVVIGDLMAKLVGCSCKYYSQGLLECLQAICKKWLPWKHKTAYSDQGILSYCLDQLDYCNGSVARRTLLLDVCRLVYPVDIHNIMCNKKSTDIFERDSQTAKEKWQHLDNDRVANLAEKFMQVTLKMLNVLVHLIEDVNPNVHLNKSGIALPGSPVRRKTQDTQSRKGSADAEEKGSLRKKLPAPASSLRANFAGHFFNEPFYMKLYENLRATYSNHKINLDPKSSIFYDFLSTVLNCLAIQLELSTEREFGSVTEELLYYLKCIMPLRSDTTVYCVTQLLKCLFGTNMITEYNDFMTIEDAPEIRKKITFYDDVMLINSLSPIETESRRNSIGSNTSQKLELDLKNPKMAEERRMLISMENFAKNKTDRKWGTNKKELERYIRLFEPVVIQALKSYTMQNDISLQCRVLSLLSQLLTLRVNYCMLDSEQIFIAFLIKQLEYVEQHEIPNCCALVNSILMFLVQLSSSKHHTKQIIEIPKLIQLCDGLMASGAHLECVAGLEPVAVKVFSNMGGGSVLGRQQQQEAQATREVLFYMLQKTMHQHKVLELVSCVLCLSQEHPESYYRWSELASDTLLNLLAQTSIEIDTRHAIASLERLLDSVYKDVLLEQSRVEILLKILFKAPPDQTSTPRKLKLRYLSIIMVLLRKVLVLIPETEILLSINYLKSSYISPQSIFFNVKPDVDPLNVQNVNENCANLSPDVILVRFLFKTLTFAITEVDNCHDIFDREDEEDKSQNALLYSVCVNIIVHVKHMLHLTTGCLFPLTAKTAQSILHNEQSGLNTGLYSPDENIPLDLLNLICLRAAHRIPLLTVHWSHLLIRMNFLSHKYWQKLLGFARELPLGGGRASPADALQTACVLAYCEYFAENGLSEAVHLTWLLVNRIHILVSQHSERNVQDLVIQVQGNAGASGLLLQAVAARCQSCLQDEFALNIYKILSLCHESQSGALIFLICRIIGKLEPAIAVRFANLAIERCRILKEMPVDDINMQLTKEDVQVALELLQRDKVHVRYSTLVVELNALASSVFDLSPLDLSQDRAINPQYVNTTNVDDLWLVNQVKSRCCQTDCSLPKIPKHKELAMLLLNLSKYELSAVMSCPEFDRKILGPFFKVACDSYLREFLNVVSVCENKELERDNIREQREMIRLHEEMISSMDSNKLNVVNSLQVFKKSDKESKSQFFIPVDEKEKFGNLELSDVETELVPPPMSDLYEVALTTFDKSLTEIIRLFPKQNRPLSQSENFNLTVEQTIDKYTRRCHQVFQDKLFYQEFITVHTILKGFLEASQRTLALIDDTDCDLLEKCLESIMPASLAKNIAIFSVISLQYLTFLIKNKKIVESPVNTDVSFRANVTVTDDVFVDNVIVLTIDNVAEALGCKEIWTGLNFDSNVNRTQSAISCLYAVMKYLVKDTKPITLKKYINTQEETKPDIIIIGDKLVSLIEYWESNFYTNGAGDVLSKCYRKPIEKLLVSLSRLDIVSNIALIPPIAWSSVDVVMKKDQLQKIDLPLQAFQDMDVLEAFLFRVNLIGWSSKKQFEEIWVALLGALQGNGGHWAVRGITRLLAAARAARHVPRAAARTSAGIQRLRNILVGTSFYSHLEDINLERIPLLSDEFQGYHCAEYNADYLKLVADIIDYAPYYVRKEVKRTKKNKEIDVNSCLQLLMDVTSQMLDPKAPTGLAARVALLNSLVYCSDVYTDAAQWRAAAALLIALSGARDMAPYSTAGRALLAAMPRALSAEKHDAQELSTVHQKLLKSLSSSYAPLRQCALQGCLQQLGARGAAAELGGRLAQHARAQLLPGTRISLYEQSLYWAVLFALVELGHPDLINVAVDFLTTRPTHYCIDLVVKGIANTIRQQVLPKELKNNVIEKLIDNTKKYSERHALQILMVHLFSADNKLLSPKLTSDVSNMDPDILMNSMERITLLYKLLRKSKSSETKRIITTALKYFLRETLPPAATLSRVVIEFLETCKDSERQKMAVISERERAIESAVMNAEVVFEVFETSVAQDQLPVLSGWIFEALSHLLHGKISSNLLPYTLLTLLVSASSNKHMRRIIPLCYYILKLGFHKCSEVVNWGVFQDFVVNKDVKMSFADRRLLCVVAKHSGFSSGQLERLKELCSENQCLADVEVCVCLDA